MELLSLPNDPLAEIVSHLPLWDLVRRVPFVNKKFLSLTRPLRLSELKINMSFPKYSLIKEFSSDERAFNYQRNNIEVPRVQARVDLLLKDFDLFTVRSLKLVHMPSYIVQIFLEKLPN